MMLRMKRPKQPPQAQSVSIPAPVGGLNSRDALSAMPPTDAITLTNFFPGTTSVDLRNGSQNWKTGLPADVESLMAHNVASGSKLFCASGTAFYDVTSSGAVGAAVVSGLTNARWQYVAMGTSGGQFIVMVNGADLPYYYDGTNWKKYASVGAQTISSITRVGTTATLTTSANHGLVTGNWVTIVGTTPAGFSGTYQVTVTGATTFTYVMAADPGGNATVVGTYTVAPALTGVDPTKLIHVNQYAKRLFFVEEDSSSVWYLAADTVSGALLEFDLSSLFNMGGYLMATATWTVDNANGINEYIIFVSSEGEVVMYYGNDPADPGNWTRAARFVTARPIGRRCFVRVGSDVILITTDGFIPMSKGLITDRSQIQDTVSNKIESLVTNDAVRYSGNFGWCAVLHPEGNKLVVNVPQNEGDTQFQYVMNTITGAWCKFTGWNANCFESFQGELYYGGNLGASANSAVVVKCDTGFSDNGAYIFGEAKTAFNYLGAPGYQKQVTMCRPIFRLGGRANISLGIDVDFADNYPASSPSFSGTAGTLWNTSLWNTFPWANNNQIQKDWQGVTGVGDAIAMHMRVANNTSSLEWQSVQYVFRMGRIL